MSTELWSALGTIIATLVFLVIPSIVCAHAVLERNYPDRPMFRMFEVHTGAPDEKGVPPIADRRQHGRRAADRGEDDAQIANPSPS